MNEQYYWYLIFFLQFLCHTYQLYLEPAKKVVKS